MSEYREALQNLCEAIGKCPTCSMNVGHGHQEEYSAAKALLARGEPDTNLLYAAATADWVQVACNGGPPCFHLDGARFCLRAERWAGHDAHGQMHRFISLAELVGESVEPAAAEKVLPDDGSYIERPPPKGYASWYDAAVDERLKRVAAEKAREQDAKRFAFWFGPDTKNVDMNGFMRGVRESWSLDRWRQFVDQQMPSPPAATEGNIK